MSLSDSKIISLKNFTDERGSLNFVEELKTIPFKISRVYYLYDIKTGASRGGHAHKENESLIICLFGELKVKIDDGINTKIFHLQSPNEGLYLPKMIWRTLFDFSHGSICLALGSHIYDEKEYIRNYDYFLKNLKNNF